MLSRRSAVQALRTVARELEATGASLTVEAPGVAPLRLGRRPDAARVVFRTPEALAPLARRDHLALAEAYLEGAIDLEGDLLEVLKVTEVIPPDPGWRERLAFGLRLLIRDRRRWQRESIAFHYDRPAELFLPWLDRWRSYSHGIYASAEDDVTAAQERKLRLAIDALGLKPGDRVFDMGCGWGAFVEFAGRQGIAVHAITISREQHRFVRALVERERLPCRVDLVDFLDFRPAGRFAGAVFMGTFEHFQDYAYAARFLAAHLEPAARFYADFCSERGSHRAGAFLARHIFPGSASYVDLPRLLRALERAGLRLHALADDSASYARTVGEWADRFEHARGELSERFGEATVRAFRLFLRASQYYLERGKTQAYHLVGGVGPARRSCAPGLAASRAARCRTRRRSQGSSESLDAASDAACAAREIRSGSGACIANPPGRSDPSQGESRPPRGSDRPAGSHELGAGPGSPPRATPSKRFRDA
jgi:cyclopropane-fatty-acyl-phospholipid synthase